MTNSRTYKSKLADISVRSSHSLPLIILYMYIFNMYPSVNWFLQDNHARKLWYICSAKKTHWVSRWITIYLLFCFLCLFISPFLLWFLCSTGTRRRCKSNNHVDTVFQSFILDTWTTNCENGLHCVDYVYRLVIAE